MSSSTSLDFKHASYDNGSRGKRTCIVCERPLGASEVTPMQQQVCGGCARAMRTTRLEVLVEKAQARKRKLELEAAAHSSNPNQRVMSMPREERASFGGPSPAMMESLVFGLVAATAGSALYATVEIATHWRIGYVAVMVGYMVGWAMRKGSKGVGGTGFQIAAAVLTYAAVAVSFVPVELYRGLVAPGHSVVGILALLGTGFAEPLIELLTYPVSGILNLFILFCGIRMAWRCMAVKPHKKRSGLRF